MNLSFYTAGVAAGGHQARIGVVANDIANANTAGYKSQNASFVDLLYTNMKEENEESEKLQNGVSTRLEKTDTDFGQGSAQETGLPLDFMIDGNGFFAVLDPATEQIKYTRCGSFALSPVSQEEAIVLGLRDYKPGDPQPCRIVDSAGNYVLDREGQPKIVMGGFEAIEHAEPPALGFGVYDFPVREGLKKQGDNYFLAEPKAGEAALVEDARIIKGSLEMSNVDLSKSFTKVIEAQRAFQLSMKMIQTSDEYENLINTLR